MVWEASQKGVPFLGVPGNSLKYMEIKTCRCLAIYNTSCSHNIHIAHAHTHVCVTCRCNMDWHHFRFSGSDIQNKALKGTFTATPATIALYFIIPLSLGRMVFTAPTRISKWLDSLSVVPRHCVQEAPKPNHQL